MKLDDMFGEFRAEFDKLKVARAEHDRLSDEIDVAEEQHAQTIREISQAYAASCEDAHTKRAEIKNAHEQALAANLAEQQRCQRQLRAIGPKIGPLVSSVVAGACGAGLPKDDDGNVVVELSTGEGDA